ncbi:LCP family protein [Cohnella nanjingensis]|uniref:LCP family protein n=1 Tax=Cohnella nanjingensis TaxID=1387779 RepID=A0A7X0RVH9_9BACL|nr:LCP family protein [Cohnella nanjingensis]MBB6674375.1 LCP family protein [Cohnella nanjingensis]
MNKQRKLRVTLLSALVVLIVAAGIGYANRGALAAWGYDAFLSKQVEERLAGSYEPINGGTATPEATPTVREPFGLLLLGVDARGKERGRSDTMIYTVVRPKDGNVLMVSIPRDTYAEIVGKGKQDKITHAYAFGGAEMAVNSAAKLLDAPIAHYGSINFQGFVKAVDTLGGIPLPIGKDIVNKGKDHEKFTVKANKDSYTGQEALNYVRYREDAGGDMARTERNRVFLDALMHKASSLQQWNKIPDLLDIVGENFKTDLTPSELSDLAKQFLQTDHHIQSYTLKGTGKRMGSQNLWYYLADEKDLADVRATIAQWLDADTPESALTVPGATPAGSNGQGAASAAGTSVNP